MTGETRRCSCSCSCRLETAHPSGTCAFCRGAYPEGVTHPGPKPAHAKPRPAAPRVQLDDLELERVQDHARRVQAAVEAQAQRDRFRPDRDDLEQRTLAAAAEFAVAKFLGLPWNEAVLTREALGRGKPADVGRNVEVRTWRGRGAYYPVRDGDPPARVIVLARGTLRAGFELVGWRKAGEVMRPAFRYDGGRGSPYWRVPAAELRPFPIPAELLA